MNRRELIKYSIASIPVLSLPSYNVLADVSKPNCDFSYENVKKQLKNNGLDYWKLIKVNKPISYKILGDDYQYVFFYIKNSDGSYSKIPMIKIENINSLISNISTWKDNFDQMGCHNYQIYMCDEYDGYFAPVGYNVLYMPSNFA